MKIQNRSRMNKEIVNNSTIDLSSVTRRDIARLVSHELIKFLPIEREFERETITDYVAKVDFHVYREETIKRIISIIKELEWTSLSLGQKELFTSLKKELSTNYSEIANKNLFT
jgi:hypothetical protein